MDPTIQSQNPNHSTHAYLENEYYTHSGGAFLIFSKKNNNSILARLEYISVNQFRMMNFVGLGSYNHEYVVLQIDQEREAVLKIDDLAKELGVSRSEIINVRDDPEQNLTLFVIQKLKLVEKKIN